MLELTTKLKGVPKDHPLADEAIDIALRFALFADVPEPKIAVDATSVTFLWGDDYLLIHSGRYQFTGPNVSITFDEENKIYFGVVLRFILDRLRSYNL